VTAKNTAFNCTWLLPGLTAAFTMLSATTGAAAESEAAEESPFSFELGAGLEYDSNITVTELDTTSGEDDIAGTLDAGFSFDHEFNDATEFQLGYSFSENFHDEFSQFDIRTHLITADLVHNFGSVEAGIAYRFADADLDSEGFLSLRQISPYLTGYLSRDLMIRAEYVQTKLTFDSRGERDADVNSIGADLYYFLNGIQSYFVVGYRYEEENAEEAQFDFSGHNFRARYFYRFSSGSTSPRVRLAWDLEDRGYDVETPFIDARRDDRRMSLSAELEVPFNDSLSLEFGYEYNDNSSRLPSADYDQNLLYAMLRWNF
jgi:hypothetical protein